MIAMHVQAEDYSRRYLTLLYLPLQKEKKQEMKLEGVELKILKFHKGK